MHVEHLCSNSAHPCRAIRCVCVLRYPSSLVLSQGAEGGGDSGKAGDGKSGGKGGGRKGGSGKEPPATVEKLDSAMESYWGNGKAADEGKGEEVRDRGVS